MPKSKKRGSSKRGTKRTAKSAVASTEEGSTSSQTLVSAPEVKFGDKAKFVRAMPIKMSAPEVIARAAAQGISLSENHVYATRQKMKAEGAAPSAAPASAVTPKAAPADEGLSSEDRQKLRQTLAATIFRLGFEESQYVFQQMQRRHHIIE